MAVIAGDTSDTGRRVLTFVVSTLNQCGAMAVTSEADPGEVEDGCRALAASWVARGRRSTSDPRPS